MAIREDLVASAAQFLQDPSVAASPVENRIAFLKAKNLTEEEVQASLARAAGDGASTHQAYPSPQAPPPGAVIAGQPPPPPGYYGSYPPYGWQPPPPEIPRRDWRDWFIMATVVGGVSYGLYALGKRYVYPLIAPPTPERLESDKKSIDDSFEKAFALVDQLAKDTQVLKEAEQERTEKLDNALAELETVVNDLKAANRRREDEAQRVRDDVSNLKDSLPKALDAQKSLTDGRLQEINAELKSLKTIVSQRMAAGATTTTTTTGAATAATAAPGSSSAAGPNNSYAAVSRAPTPAAAAAAPITPVPASTPANNNSGSGSNGAAESSSNATTDADKKPVNGSPSNWEGSLSNTDSSSPFSSGITASAVKIPEWQRAMASKRNNSVSLKNNSSSSNNSSNNNKSTTDAGSSAQAEASGSGA
ncbi:peroxisomal membrane anchor protein conserved region-domain-containing protein [Coniella lustricola]|uniref:Peroxisomal membrane protein PEX14 n=1 Tax=Coniella lustricola TaxID=2025994 RepID=A0A2T2ZTA3_9PEZI|nr:peroxisomal membrane anchor protein conserved region-domain-containing protein [Coniella lustricola]